MRVEIGYNSLVRSAMKYVHILYIVQFRFVKTLHRSCSAPGGVNISSHHQLCYPIFLFYRCAVPVTFRNVYKQGETEGHADPVEC
jgi:hypothetical protein